MTKKRKIINLGIYYLVVALVRFLNLIPRKAGIGLMRWLSFPFYLLSIKQRRLTILHLTQVFGGEKSEREIKRMARNVFRHFATVGVDAVRMPLLLKEGIDRYVTAENMHYLEEAYKKGRGMILLTGHFGNWELMGAWVASRGYPLHVIGSSESNPWVNDYIVEHRRKAGYITIARAKETRKIIKALQKGYPLGILMDQDTRAKGIFVDFFGKKANTPIGPILLARRYNIPIVPMFMNIKESLTYHVKCLEPIILSDTGNPEKDLYADVWKCNEIYEKVIREHPEQWAWMHRRWRRQPDL